MIIPLDIKETWFVHNRLDGLIVDTSHHPAKSTAIAI